MKNGHNNRVTKRSIMATLVISCMLACAFSPVISTLGDDESSVYADGIALNYVSLGDSMVNGCGMYDYYTQEGDNYFGFEVEVDNTYPVIVKNHLESQGFDVNLNQLAVSGIRSGEIRNLLDPGFVGDYYTANETDASLGAYSHILKALERYQDISGNAEADLDDLRAYYTTTISEADIISYQVHWDLGTAIDMVIKSIVMGGTYKDPSFDLYIDPAILDAMAEIRAVVEEAVQYILAELDIVLDDYMGIIDAAERFMETITYVIVGYCANFDANMEKIFELNPDADVFVLDNYANTTGMSLVVGDMVIPIDKVNKVIVEVLNLYTKYLSPYACMTNHVDIDGFISTFSYDYIDYGEGVDEISEDTEYIMHLIFKELGQDVYMDSLACDLGTENLFFKEVFSNKDLDMSALSAFDKAAMVEKLKSAMTMFGVDCHTKALPENQCRCVMTQDDDGVTLNGYVLDGADPTPASVSFSNDELGLLQFYLAVYSMGCAMIHPSATGHATVADELIDAIDDSFLVSGPTLSNEMTLGTGTPASGGIGTLVGLLDDMALGNYSVSDIAERLGLDVDDIILPQGVRINDINYLLGGTDVLDVYGQELLTAAAAECGVGIEEFRQMYQDAVIDSSAVVVAAGSNNITAGIAAGITAITGGETAELDFTDVGVDPMLVSAIQDLRATINEVLVNILGEDSEVVTTIETALDVVDNIAYGIAGYVDNYGAMVDAIVALNPDAKIIVLGPYNMLEGVVYDNGTLKVDIGSIGQLLVGALNHYNDSQMPESDNVIYVNMTNADVDKPEFNIAGFNFETDMGALMENMALSENGRLALNDSLGDAFSGNQYTITFDLGNGDSLIIRTYEFGAAIDPPATIPTKTGHTFAGWDGTVPATMPACDLYFTAVFEPYSYTINFNANTGAGEMGALVAYYDVPVTLDANAFTKDGFVFAGWNTAADGTGTTYANGAQVTNLCVEDGAEITLYAMWNDAPKQGGIDSTIIIAAVIIVAIAGVGAFLFLRRH